MKEERGRGKEHEASTHLIEISEQAYPWCMQYKDEGSHLCLQSRHCQILFKNFKTQQKDHSRITKVTDCI